MHVISSARVILRAHVFDTLADIFVGVPLFLSLIPVIWPYGHRRAFCPLAAAIACGADPEQK